ncbi:hypothetical protein CRENPOLYSF2_2320003 [Crenothrix polyspora]|uniref:Uncharacterized protein n=1 Tax=Crenothrix polyspora TaxID=360316 RepID=A0A1R4H640_9GAMM|nr:hypothetical protein CRENPOLYSF2_2320003 [Crenothrix polyspora]
MSKCCPVETQNLASLQLIPQGEGAVKLELMYCRGSFSSANDTHKIHVNIECC